MKPISLVRFNAFAAYARAPHAAIYGEEVGWYEHVGGAIVGMLMRDRSDNDFGGLVFAPDAKGRYRWTNGTAFHASRRRAEIELRQAMEAAAHAPQEEHHQGDEVGKPVDFFAYMRPQAELNADFVGVAERVAYGAARRIIEPMMRWYEDADGNFVEQFQTTGFDQRIWELYLFAAFTEMGYVLDRREPVPDFLLDGLLGEIAVEATTVGPTRGGALGAPPKLESPETLRAFVSEYMPIKYGSALFSKLQKRYWEKPNVAGKPLVFAIEDFSAPGSMVMTRSAIDTYLYGVAHDWQHDAEGKLTIIPRKIVEHRWGDKAIPSGFFDQPEAENVSAVLFSNSGTIAKFNRMGVLAGFGSPDVVLIREGTSTDHDPNAAAPIVFRQLVNSERYRESWVEGLDVFHNPNALLPLTREAFPGAAHHFLLPDGQIESWTPDWHPLGSRTIHFEGHTMEQVLAHLARRGLDVAA